ncbi:MAG: DeoR family transcriptional regulator [Anaerolineales bacterium]|nr:DeoR family transcriptional regulator [Anaerolineales bacterium]
MIVTEYNGLKMNYRQKRILEKLAQEDVLSIAALAQELSVSKMTIHRDLDALSRAGLISKQHGKITATARLRGVDPSLCQMCDRKIKERNVYILIGADGKKVHLCCPHCGLIAYSHGEDVWQCFATDFLHGHVITASQAHYLFEPDLRICCSPSVLAFASVEEAQKFQKGFGGQIVDFNLAVELLTKGRAEF